MFGQMANLLNANMLQDPSNNPWMVQNGPGVALGRAGSALGPAGSALGGAPNVFNASLGSAPSTLNAGISAARPSVAQGAGSLYGGSMPGASQFGLDAATKGGKGAGIGKMFSGVNGANIGVGAANAVGLPQAILGRTAGGALGAGASGALTGFQMGGPWGAAAGGGLGMLTSLLGGGGQKPRPQVPVTMQAQPDLYSNY